MVSTQLVVALFESEAAAGAAAEALIGWDEANLEVVACAVGVLVPAERVNAVVTRLVELGGAPETHVVVVTTPPQVAAARGGVRLSDAY